MKKRVCFFMVVLLSFCLLANCTTTKQNVSFGLDSAIDEAAKTISDNLPQGAKIAVVNFTSTADDFSEYVIEELSVALADGKKLVIVDRRELELIRSEMKFQFSGEVDDDSMSSIGRILGAQFIITGSLVDAGTFYRFRADAINVQNATKESPVSLRIEKSDKQIVHFFPNTNSQSSSTSRASSNDPIRSLLIKNSTGIDVYFFYIRQSGTNKWSEDLLTFSKVYIIDANDIHNVSLEKYLNSSNRYDLVLIDDDDNVYIKKNIQLAQDRIIEFKRSDLDKRIDPDSFD